MFNADKGNKRLVSKVHKLQRLFLTVQISSATSERTFSALKRVKTYLRSTITEEGPNNCLMVHVYKEIADNLDFITIAWHFVLVEDTRKKRFGCF